MKLSDLLKKAQTYFMAMGALLSLPFFQSCLDKGNDYDYSLLWPSAIVTVKPVTGEDGDYFYFQLNDQTRLWPVDNNYLPYKEKEMRAFVNYTETEMPADVDKEMYDMAVKVNWMDSILTKKTVDAAVADFNIDEYGNDPVEIFNDWMTNVEDGYLTIHFLTLWGNTGIKHSVNLITGTNPDNPYEVVFKHNDFDDVTHNDPNGYGYEKREGIVAFRLSDLPDTNGETVKLTLKFDSFSGEKTAEFDYCTRKD